MSQKDPGFVVLTGEGTIEYLPRTRESSVMWRRLVAGERIFIKGYKPNQLGYWYRKALAADMKLVMKQASVDGNEGSIIEREFPAGYTGATEPETILGAE